MLNYKEHPSKSSHAQLDENSIGMFLCTFLTNIYSAHKYLLSYHFLYKLQEHENKAMYMLAIYRNYMIYYSFIMYRQWSFSSSSSSTVGYNIDSSSETIYVIAVTCPDMFMVFVSLRESLPFLSWVQWSKDNAFRYCCLCCIK
ncbi:hypothetical protein M9H77_02781 [Catharanthus roseus]|uniref:Uncharacterized protein n=1 Tax=Catharanthus roseus TaxID=4058 RepID=A0ACC0C9V0_CATRO|nr:hypothetical protein M9H77_02781 [Catharanthus roseus]